MARLSTSNSAPVPLKAAEYSPCGSTITIWPCGASSQILWRISAALVDLPVPVEPSSAKCLPSIARSEEHTSELQSLMRISYAVFCLKKTKKITAQDKKHTM